MDTSEFRGTYGTSARRLDLIELLEEFLERLVQSYSGVRVVVFGSILTDIPNPDDIDLLVDAVAVPGDKQFGAVDRLPNLAPPGIHVRGGWSSTFVSKEPRSSEEMVDEFNETEANRSKGIICDRWLELST